jgi:hypothetical protein
MAQDQIVKHTVPVHRNTDSGLSRRCHNLRPLAFIKIGAASDYTIPGSEYKRLLSNAYYSTFGQCM